MVLNFAKSDTVGPHRHSRQLWVILEEGLEGDCVGDLQPTLDIDPFLSLQCLLSHLSMMAPGVQLVTHYPSQAILDPIQMWCACGTCRLLCSADG